MLLLTSTSDIVRLTTSAATSTIEVHASFVDMSGTTITPGRANTRITTATTTTIVDSPAASTQRNVKAIYVTNNSTGTNCIVGVEHFDGTNSVELMQFVLLPGDQVGPLDFVDLLISKYFVFTVLPPGDLTKVLHSVFTGPEVLSKGFI